MKPGVTVSFVYAEYMYDPWLSHINLGNVSWRDADKIMNAIDTYKPTPNVCIRELHANLVRSASFDGITTTHTSHRQLRCASLEIGEMFDRTGGFHAPCMQSGTNIPQTASNMTKMCAHNLKCGKCQNEFMRNVLGPALFPEHYKKHNTR